MQILPPVSFYPPPVVIPASAIRIDGLFQLFTDGDSTSCSCKFLARLRILASGGGADGRRLRLGLSRFHHRCGRTSGGRTRRTVVTKGAKCAPACRPTIAARRGLDPWRQTGHPKKLVRKLSLISPGANRPPKCNMLHM